MKSNDDANFPEQSASPDQQAGLLYDMGWLTQSQGQAETSDSQDSSSEGSTSSVWARYIESRMRTFETGRAR